MTTDSPPKWKLVKWYTDQNDKHSIGIPPLPAQPTCLCPFYVPQVEHLSGYSLECFWIGTSKGELLEFRFGSLQSSHPLSGIPQQIQQAKVDLQEDIIIVHFPDRTVQLLHSKSFSVLQEYKNIQHVLVGDFLHNGKDYIMLLNEGMNKNSLKEFILTDTAEVHVVNGQQQTPQKKQTEYMNLEPVVRSLENRLVIGMQELQKLQHDLKSKEQLISNTFNLLQSLQSDPTTTIEVPTFSHLVPLHTTSNKKVPTVIPAAKVTVVKPFLLQQCEHYVHGGHILMSLTAKNSCSNEVTFVSLIISSTNCDIFHTICKSDLSTVAPDQSITVMGTCPVPLNNAGSIPFFYSASTMQDICLVVLIEWSSYDSKQSLQYIHTVTIPPEELLGLTEKHDTKPLFFAERDILVLSTTTPIKNLLSIFTDCLKLRACVRQEGVIVLSSEPNAVTPIQVSITPVSKQAECTVQAADEAALTNVMHILTKNLPKDVSAIPNPLNSASLHALTKLVKALMDEVDYALKWMSTTALKERASTKEELGEFLEFRKEYVSKQQITDQLFGEYSQRVRTT